MELAARAALSREGFSEKEQHHQRMLAARYQGQSFELEIKWNGARNIAQEFHRAHRARYGYAQEENPVEIVSARLRSSGLVKKIRTMRAGSSSPGARGRTRIKARPQAYALVQYHEGEARTAVYHRDELQADDALSTPCIVTEYSATTLIPPGARAILDQYGNLLIEP
jgi:N-methylhydantoinase A